MRARGGRAGAPPAAVKIAACHVRNGDRVMRADARRWLRANGRAPGRVAAILAGDFNDDLTAASRADSDYARSLCRVLWPRRAAGNENYPEAYWVHENNSGEKTRKYDPRAEARDAGFDHRGWDWGSYHGYHGLARFYDGQFVNKGRIIDGAACFGESESSAHAAARHRRLRLRDIDEDAGELAAVMRHAPSTTVQTDLTPAYFVQDKLRPRYGPFSSSSSLRGAARLFDRRTSSASAAPSLGSPEGPPPRLGRLSCHLAVYLHAWRPIGAAFEEPPSAATAPLFFARRARSASVARAAERA